MGSALKDACDVTVGKRDVDVAKMFDPGCVLCAHGEYGTVVCAAVAPTLRSSLGATSAAVKIVHVSGSAGAALRGTVKRLTGRAARGCPQLVRYVGAWPRVGDTWVVSELLEGGSARDVLGSAAAAELEACVAYIMRQSLLGLQHLHNVVGIAHGNMCASNLLLAPPAAVKLADYGVYDALRQVLSGRQCYAGARLWPPPEGATTTTKASDIWALAVTCVELLDGPAALANARRSGRSVPRVARPTNWSMLLKEFIAAAAVVDPRFRPSVDQLLTHRFIAGASDTVLARVLDREQARSSTPEEPMVFQNDNVVEKLFRSGHHAMRLPIFDVYDIPIDAFCGNSIHRRPDASDMEQSLWVVNDALKEIVDTGRTEDKEKVVQSSRRVSKWFGIAAGRRGFR